MPSFESLKAIRLSDRVENIYVHSCELYKKQLQLFEILREDFKEPALEHIADMFSDFSELIVNLAVQAEEGMILKNIIRPGQRYKKRWWKSGLKLWDIGPKLRKPKSLPTRERGLKP